MKTERFHLRLRRFSQFGAAVSLALQVGAGASEVVPVPAPGTNGSTWSHVPFSGLTLTDVPPMRFQQVYDASAFSLNIPNGGWISGLWFVSDLQVGRGWSASLPKVEILMSLTANHPDALSSAFADNISFAPIVVHPLGGLLLSSARAGAEVYVGFQTPFFYNPSEGNLLLEIKNFEPTCCPGVPQLNGGPLDAYEVLGDPISRVYAGGDANATTGIADTLGLTTFFVVTPVPEPSVLALFGLAVGIYAWGCLRKKRDSIKH